MYCYGGMAVAMGNRKGGRGSIRYIHKPNDTYKISANIKVASSDVSALIALFQWCGIVCNYTILKTVTISYHRMASYVVCEGKTKLYIHNYI